MTAPKSVKQPEDHKPKVDADEVEVPRVVTVQGNEYTIVPEALDDFELLGDIDEMDQKRNAVKMPSILRRLLGPEQTQNALNTLRDADTGRITVDAGSGFVNDLFEALDPN